MANSDRYAGDALEVIRIVIVRHDLPCRSSQDAGSAQERCRKDVRTSSRGTESDETGFRE